MSVLSQFMGGGGGGGAGVPLGAYVEMPPGAPNIVTDGSATYLRTGVQTLASNYPTLPAGFTTFAPPGEQWSSQPSGGLDIVMSNGSIVVGFKGAQSYWSTDFVTWTAGTAVVSAPQDITWSGTKFFAVTGGSWICSSTDGKTWTSTNVSGINPYFVAANGSTIVGIYTNGTTYHALSTNGGATWSVMTMPQSGYSYVGIAYGSGKFVVAFKTGASVLFYTSTDGSTWTAGTSISLYYPGALSFAGGLFLIADANADKRVWRSADGVAWTAGGATTLAIGTTTKFTKVGSYFYVSVSTYIYASPDGNVWASIGVTNGSAAGISDGTTYRCFAAGGSSAKIVVGSPYTATAELSRPASTTSMGPVPVRYMRVS